MQLLNIGVLLCFSSFLLPIMVNTTLLAATFGVKLVDKSVQTVETLNVQVPKSMGGLISCAWLCYAQISCVGFNFGKAANSNGAAACEFVIDLKGGNATVKKTKNYSYYELTCSLLCPRLQHQLNNKNPASNLEDSVYSTDCFCGATESTSSTIPTTTATTTTYDTSNLYIGSSSHTVDNVNVKGDCNNMANHGIGVVIKSQAKQDAVTSLIKQNGQSGDQFWIGIGWESNQWVYDDSTVVSQTFQKWGSSSVPVGDSNNCIRALIKYEQPDRWYCDGINKHYRFICDKGSN